jgi:hypothetical protein
MNFNRDALTKLLALDDESLKKVLAEIATEAGVDPSSFNVSSADISKLRSVLSIASNDDIAAFIAQFGKGGKLNG